MATNRVSDGFYRGEPGQIEPAEFESSDPVTCAECGTVWDADDDRDSYTEGPDDNVYCNSVCIGKANNRWEREELAEEVLPLLKDLAAKAWKINQKYDDANSTAPDSGFLILEAAAAHMGKFVTGQDSGFRDGVMLQHNEVSIIRFALEWEMQNLFHTLRRRMEEKSPSTFLIHENATSLARLGRALLLLNEGADRSDNGGEQICEMSSK